MLVVFDLDGTVVDSSLALLRAHEAAFASVGLERPSDHAILDLVGLPLVHTMRTLAPEQDAEGLANAYSKRLRAYRGRIRTTFRRHYGVTVSPISRCSGNRASLRVVLSGR